MTLRDYSVIHFHHELTVKIKFSYLQIERISDSNQFQCCALGVNVCECKKNKGT
jgi:hypothetical protein